MNPRDWLFVAFIVAGIVGVSAMWAADMQTKRQAAADSIEAVRAAQAESRYDYDRREALEKLHRIYGR